MYLGRYILALIYFVILNCCHYFLNYLDISEYFLSDSTLGYDIHNSVYDYIIVGCGSAGAIVARRLAQDKNVKILVLEAGTHLNKLFDIPSVGIVLQGTRYDWQYKTVPQQTACFSLDNNVSRWPRGKIVGGTSRLNNLIYIRGHPADYDEWFINKRGYNYTQDVLPYFNRLEISKKNKKGSVYISDLPYTSELPAYVLKAAEDIGFGVLNDTKEPKIGVGMQKVNMLNGSRWTSASHFLHGKYPNVVLRSNALAEVIRMHDNFEAYGVEFRYQGKRYFAKASKGVVLSAGVIETPKILVRSGIGRKDHLTELNIPLKVDLPVGENLQDHITTGFDLIILNRTLDIGVGEMLAISSVSRYFTNGEGPWTTVGCEAVSFIDTNSQNSSIRPDLQLMIMPLGIVEDTGLHLRKLMGISDRTWDRYFSPLNNETTVTFLPILLHPKSKGYVRLKDNDVESDPIIDPRYLSHRDDVDVLIKGIDYIKRIIKTDEMQKLGARLNTNVFPGCENYTFDTYRYWECYVRHLTITSYHPVGTCKMGHEKDPTTVVNYDFEVKGTNKLFVVDGSVLPTLTSGNPYASIMMLAEMASDILKNKQFYNNGKCHITELFISRYIC